MVLPRGMNEYDLFSQSNFEFSPSAFDDVSDPIGTLSHPSAPEPSSLHSSPKLSDTHSVISFEEIDNIDADENEEANGNEKASSDIEERDEKELPKDNEMRSPEEFEGEGSREKSAREEDEVKGEAEAEADDEKVDEDEGNVKESSREENEMDLSPSEGARGGTMNENEGEGERISPPGDDEGGIDEGVKEEVCNEKAGLQELVNEENNEANDDGRGMVVAAVDPMSLEKGSSPLVISESVSGGSYEVKQYQSLEATPQSVPQQDLAQSISQYSSNSNNVTGTPNWAPLVCLLHSFTIFIHPYPHIFLLSKPCCESNPIPSLSKCESLSQEQVSRKVSPSFSQSQDVVGSYSERQTSEGQTLRLLEELAAENETPQSLVQTLSPPRHSLLFILRPLVLLVLWVPPGGRVRF